MIRCLRMFPSACLSYLPSITTLTLHRINSKAAFFILKAGAQHVKEGGKIITIVTSLLAAFTGFYTSYAGSKAPVEHFTRGVSKELMSKRISVNAVAPGPMDTRQLFLSPVAYFTHRRTTKLIGTDWLHSILLSPGIS